MYENEKYVNKKHAINKQYFTSTEVYPASNYNKLTITRDRIGGQSLYIRHRKEFLNELLRLEPSLHISRYLGIKDLSKLPNH
jgi:hypothetical protein